MLPSLQILPQITIKNKRPISHFCVLIEEKNRHALYDRYESSLMQLSEFFNSAYAFHMDKYRQSSYLKGFHIAVFFITALPKGPVKSYP